MSETRSDRRKTKEQKVLELCNQGYPYRKIASLVHLSLRDVTKFVNLASNKIMSPSVTSIHDEIILEYRVNLLRSELEDLKIERDSLKDEVKDLRAQKYDLVNQVHARQSELDVVKRNLEYKKFSDIERLLH
jgi:cell division protein FtsB